jgi:hypothetical protein
MSALSSIAVPLRQQHSSNPSQRRVHFVRQHTQKGEVGASFASTASRGFEQSAPVEPVAVAAESMNAVRARQIRRAPSGASPIAQVVPAKLAGSRAAACPRKFGRARRTLVHSVKPSPHHASFSGIGWYWGR